MTAPGTAKLSTDMMTNMGVNTSHILALIDPGHNLKREISSAALIPYRMANAKIAWDKFDFADGGKILTLQQAKLGGEKSEYLIIISAPGFYLGCLASFIQDAK
jgi:hypothetical protein